MFGLRDSLERRARQSLGVLSIYAAWVVGSAVLVLFVSNLVWLSVGMQVLNAVLLPIIFAPLIIIAATLLPDGARIAGWRLRVTVVLVGIVAAAGLVGAVAGLLR